jgi:ABC-type bacteriocin/lantibiotic exporter with double-glycine peptidase domain
MNWPSTAGLVMSASLALPMAYFQARRVGDSVARVRELENIRN